MENCWPGRSRVGTRGKYSTIRVYCILTHTGAHANTASAFPVSAPHRQPTHASMLNSTFPPPASLLSQMRRHDPRMPSPASQSFARKLTTPPTRPKVRTNSGLISLKLLIDLFPHRTNQNLHLLIFSSANIHIYSISRTCNAVGITSQIFIKIELPVYSNSK